MNEIKPLKQLEQEMIILALDRLICQSKVARALGIGKSTLQRKMKQYGITPRRPYVRG